ncbi:MAG: chemotaxis response regulator protein-glutamate methylesterase [Oscillospiraceae bacterium]
MRVLKKIRVLIVDDSAVFRELLSREISADDVIEVVATACDAYDARDKIVQYNPDVMLLDIEMPKMNGLDFLQKLLPQYPMRVIVTSAASNRVFDALNAGALDYVPKPGSDTGTTMQSYINEMIIKIKTASIAKIQTAKTGSNVKTGHNIKASSKNKIIAIGASTGGTEAIIEVLKSFSNDIPGVVITQHMPPVFTNMYAQRLNKILCLNVKEAQDGDVIKPGTVLIAPGDFQMTVKKIGSVYKVRCTKGEKVNGHCPSVDVLFQSIAKELGANSIGIILTGMGCDGAKGLLDMKKSGARTIGQGESSCVVYGMPKVAYNIGAVENQADLDEIGQLVYSFLED